MIATEELPKASEAVVQLQWGIKVPLRDGIHLNAALYLPIGQVRPAAAIITLTPYIAQTCHERGMYFAAHGFPFLAVDCRGRGNSQGEFNPNIQEANDGYDLVEWLANQPYCNGQVAMWGGSYGGYAQWVTAKEFPPHLATIVPVASPYFGVDFPMRNNMASPYLMQWLTLVWGRTSQDKLFWNQSFWGEKFRQWFVSGAPFKELDSQLGSPSAIFQEWLAHPHQDAYWDCYNPTGEQYAKLSLPILTITGIYDVDQPGALTHYREHVRHAASEVRQRHYLVIGPWDHAGTRSPQAEFAGVECGPESLLDLSKLHLEWYAWTMQGGSKPPFLQKNVAYYVMGAEKWRYAETLEAVTVRSEPLYLRSTGHPIDVFHSGSLMCEPSEESAPDQYVYDPRDVSHAALESTIDPTSVVDQRLICAAAAGKQLVYHSAPFERDTEVSGFFRLSAWLSIDQPDTDFHASVYEIGINGGSILLTQDAIRARHRESLREEMLVQTTAPLRYDFERFTFVARLLKQGSRLRLVIGPKHSIYSQKNYNSGGGVSEESMADARPVTVKLFHDPSRPSALHVPFGR